MVNYMKKLNSSQRSYLKSQAHHLEPVVHIGKNGLTDGTIHSINTALSAKELIKIKFLECRDTKQAISETISKDTLSLIVGIIGHTLILFKQNKNPEKQKYRLP